jgi:hypothetical protein
MDAQEILGWVQASKAAVDLLKSAYKALPAGEKRSEVENKVRIAEQILERSDSKLAKELGFNLCKCTWPPQIMLWNESERAEYARDRSAITGVLKVRAQSEHFLLPVLGATVVK